MSGFSLNTDLISRLAGRIAYLGTKNDIVSQNIANLETPNYKAKEMSFEGYLQDEMGHAEDSGMRGALIFSPKVNVEDSSAHPKPNGNNVSMEEEMADLADNSIEFMVATETIKKQLAMLKFAASER